MSEPRRVEASIGELLDRAFAPAGFQHRESEDYGDVMLSVQASELHYSTPKQAGLDLSEYSTVEVALVPKSKSVKGFYVPSELGIDGMDEYFESKDDGYASPVAGYMPQAAVQQLRDRLAERVKS